MEDQIAIRMRLLGGKEVAAESEVAAKGIASTGTAAKKASASQAASMAKLNKTAASLRSVGRGLTTYVSLPIAGVGVAAGVMALNFDRSMRNVNSIAQLPEKRFNALKNQVLDLAGPTAQAPLTLSEGLYDLVSSGFKANESIGILRASAIAASAGLTTTEVSTKAVAAVLNAYQLKASAAGKVSDTLFETVNRGVLTFDDLATTIGDVLPFAAQLHVNLNEIGAATSTMTKAGLSAPETMTRLKNTLVTLLKPGKELKARLVEMNTTGEALVAKKGLQGALEAIIAPAHGSKEAIAAMFPNIRALGGVLSLTGRNSARAAEDLANFRDTTGATAKVLKEQEKSFGFQMQRAWAELSSVLIKLGEQLLPVVIPALLDLAHAGGAVVSWFTELPAPMQKVVVEVTALAALAGPMLLFASAMLTAAKNLGILQAVEGGGVGLNKGGIGRFALGGAGLAAIMAGQSGVGGKGGEALGNIGGGAALGFSVGGPWGAAIGGGLGAIATAVPMISKLVSGEKRLTFQQQRLADSAKSVKEWWSKQRQAAHGLTAADERVRGAHQRAHRATQEMQQAQRHLGAVISEYGRKSRPAIHAEAVLTGKIHAHSRALKHLRNDERLHGLALSAYKTATTSTVLAERHRINVLTQLRDKQARLFQAAKQANPLSERTRELASKLLGTENKLAKEQQKHAATITAAAKEAGPKYARFLQKGSQETLRFGGEVKLATKRLNDFAASMERLSEANLRFPNVPEGSPLRRPEHHPGHNASGTNFWTGGLSWVGERGPELLDLPRSSRVIPALRSREIVGSPQTAKLARREATAQGRPLYATIKVGRKAIAEVVTEAKEDAEARL